MKINGALEKELADAGLCLEENEDFLYLQCGDCVIAAWYAPSALPANIHERIAAFKESARVA